MMRSFQVLVVLSLMFFSVSLSAETKKWSGDQAYLLPAGHWESGLFSPFRLGINESLEIETRPLAFFIIPNVKAKIALPDQGSWRIASKHSLHVPTFLLRTLAKEGSFGLLPLESEIPLMVGIGTGIVATTKLLSTPNYLSIEGGVIITPKFGHSDFPELELPLLYLRTASYHDTVTASASITLEGKLFGSFNYSLQQKALIAPGYNGALSVEQSAKVMWRLHENFELVAGAQSVLTRYPRQTRLNIFPLFDARFGF